VAVDGTVTAGRAPTDDEFAAQVVALTNAFGDPTRRQIYLFARESPAGVTASETAERFGLHPNVARHHLDKLASGGYLVVTVERPDGAGAGRPSKHYRAPDDASADVSMLAPRRDDLLITLLGRALALVPAEAAEAMAEGVGEEYGRLLAQSMSPGDGHRSFQQALHAVADALTAHGFAAHTESRGRGSIAIVSDHCPFGAAAVQHPVICAVDRGLVKGMLSSLYGETRPTLESSRPRGDDHCITRV
jgi:predicted ArsR family transcriptional regulator